MVMLSKHILAAVTILPNPLAEEVTWMVLDVMLAE
jgi:hypothetical protein